MTNEELKSQIALGLIKIEEIDPILIYNLDNSKLLHSLAKIFYRNLLHQLKDEGWDNFIRKWHDSMHEHFLTNPNTSNETRILINKHINEFRKRSRYDS